MNLVVEPRDIVLRNLVGAKVQRPSEPGSGASWHRGGNLKKNYFKKIHNFFSIGPTWSRKLPVIGGIFLYNIRGEYHFYTTSGQELKDHFSEKVGFENDR